MAVELLLERLLIFFAVRSMACTLRLKATPEHSCKRLPREYQRAISLLVSSGSSWRADQLKPSPRACCFAQGLTDAAPAHWEITTPFL